MHKTKREYVSPLLSPNDCVYMNVTVLILYGVLMVLKCPLRLSISRLVKHTYRSWWTWYVEYITNKYAFFFVTQIKLLPFFKLICVICNCNSFHATLMKLCTLIAHILQMYTLYLHPIFASG
jgi:hypothetical protein